MANEFVARKGLTVFGNTVLSGSLTVSGSATIASSLTATSISGSFSGSGANIYGVNAATLTNVPVGVVSSSTQVKTLLPTGTVSSSIQINTGSFSGSITTASFATTASAATSITFTPTTASFAQTASYVNPLNQDLSATGNITAGQYLVSNNSTGDEGGEILLAKPQTNSTIAGTGLTIDVYQNRLRIFEQGGTARGGYWDITTLGAGASTNLTAGSGTVTSVTAGSGLTGGTITGAGTITLDTGSAHFTGGVAKVLVTSASFATTSSFATSASWAPGGTTFPFTGAAVISGSLIVTGSSGVTVTGPVTITGALQATTKSFKIDHQLLLGKKLIYGVLEGPEHGVYVRGRVTKNNIIQLPEEWEWLIDPDSITVQLTPIGTQQILYVQSIENNTVIINSNTPIDCFYYVQATRKDVAPLTTVE